MQIKSKYSWMKHIDFIIVDLIALFLSFVISFYLKFNNLSFGENDEWREEELRGVQAEERVELATSEFEFFMMSLRKLRGFNKSEFTRIFSKTLPEKFLKLFTEWEKKGLCFSSKNAGDTTYAMSRQGMLFLNRFLEELC